LLLVMNKVIYKASDILFGRFREIFQIIIIIINN
jgi:hypothetical protein